ncbi:zona pellucida-binding protein 1 isoform X1 [Phascolarctos cinereus]|uniref:Zona pellucida-binding protein 1 isoform X1 n=1 Tax=Phascolarctos cinereus TaxID=38626 RepID=A0A6P5JSB1_PHACI|nr:zona pellucida-binding protein 1 isoform X1 [Phascolarctos cinereus]
MEGGARVLLRRARGRGLARSCGTRCFPSLSLLLLLLVHFQTSLPIRYIYPARYLRQILEDEDTVKLVGSTNIPVKIYVMLHQNSPHIPCITKKLRDVELVDPVFLWHTPIGSAIPENSVKVTTTGSLILYNFSEEMSGVYTCSLSYKHTAEEAQKIIQVKYVVYAFINPHFYYQFSARYHFVSCNSTYNISFEKKLLHILRTLLADLSCDVSSVKTECHLIKMQESGLQNELFFTFSVVPIENVTTRPDACTSSSCNPVERLDKAKDLIEKFFVQQARVLRKHFQILPEIYYIEGTLQTVWIRHCSPGYGMNALLHPNCPECCVICKPGTYNPHNGTQCLQCNSSMVYGAKKC